MQDNEFYQKAYNSFRESYEIVRSASFLPLQKLRSLSQGIISVYTQIVPEKVRDSFEIKVRDLEEFLKARETAERLIVLSTSRF